MNEALKNLLTRRSCRAYKPDQIKNEELEAILEAGVYAPTGRGMQSPLIVVLQDPEAVNEVERINAAVTGNEDAKTFYGAPTVIIIFADPKVPYGVADGNMIIGNMLNAANAIGVDSCYIWRAKEAFSSDKGKALMKKWGIPDDFTGVGNVILGYGLPGGKKEAAPRKEGYIIRP